MLISWNISAQNVSVPKTDLLILIQNNEKGKKARALVPVYEKKIDLLEQSNFTLKSVVVSKDSTIDDQKKQIGGYVQIVRNDSIIQRNNEYIITGLQKDLKSANKATRRAKRGTLFVGGTGIAAVGYLAFKLLTK